MRNAFPRRMFNAYALRFKPDGAAMSSYFLDEDFDALADHLMTEYDGRRHVRDPMTGNELIRFGDE